MPKKANDVEDDEAYRSAGKHYQLGQQRERTTTNDCQKSNPDVCGWALGKYIGCPLMEQKQMEHDF